jgi:mRNA interferase RelE/StbE
VYRPGPAPTVLTGAQLRQQRVQAGLAQTELGRRLGVTVSAVCMWEAAAQRELATLPRAIARRIAAAIEPLAADPRPAGVRKLAGGSGEGWRIRVGDHRVLYEIRDAELLITVVKLAHRRQVYHGR